MKAINLINDSLVEATKNGESLQVRSNIALASTMAELTIAQAGVVAEIFSISCQDSWIFDLWRSISSSSL